MVTPSPAPTAPPSQTQPVLDSGGTLANPWRRFLEALWRRTGGFQEISVKASDDTHLVFSYRGSDGVVRTGSLTLT